MLKMLSADVKNLGPLAPFGSIFDVMEKYENDHFFHPWYACSRKRLRPARMLSFRDADGKMVKIVLKTCIKCNKVKRGVRDEFCGHVLCRTAYNVCRNCATEFQGLGVLQLRAHVHTCQHGL
jgi:hypothetical protein